MNLQFDIFEKENGDSVLWRAAAATLEEAKRHVQQFAITSPGEYVILSLRTGNKLVIKCGDLDGAAGIE